MSTEEEPAPTPMSQSASILLGQMVFLVYRDYWVAASAFDTFRLYQFPISLE